MKLTEQDIREYIQDRSAADNDGMGLSFSTAEIASAMKNAARAYNSIPPLVSFVSPDDLSGDTTIFLDAVAEQLYIAERARLMRQDIDYNAGGVVTPIERKRIEHLGNLIKEHADRFRTAAVAHKRSVNISRGYRHFT